MSAPTLAEAKAQAKALRRALAETGRAISHAQALEMIAAQHGARDWNTLHARLAQAAPPPPWQLDQRVKGRYLGQPFTGRITGLSQRGARFAVTLRLDQPVDTVRFDSFSNLRRTIHATISADGLSPRRTSDGAPQLSLEAL